MSGRDSPENQNPQTNQSLHLTGVGRLSPFQVENLTPKKLDLGGLSSDFSRLRSFDPGVGLELKRSFLQLIKRTSTCATLKGGAVRDTNLYPVHHTRFVCTKIQLLQKPATI